MVHEVDCGAGGRSGGDTIAAPKVTNILSRPPLPKAAGDVTGLRIPKGLSVAASRPYRRHRCPQTCANLGQKAFRAPRVDVPGQCPLCAGSTPRVRPTPSTWMAWYGQQAMRWQGHGPKPQDQSIGLRKLQHLQSKQLCTHILLRRQTPLGTGSAATSIEMGWPASL